MQFCRPDCNHLVLSLLLAVTGCSDNRPSGQTVAVVNGQAITQKELEFELSVSGVPQDQWKAIKPQVLQTLIDRKLVVQDAENNDLDQRSETVMAQQRARDLVLAERATQVLVSQVQKPVSAGDVEQYMVAHPELRGERRYLTVEQLRFAMPIDEVTLSEVRAIRSMFELSTFLANRRMAFQRGSTEIDTASLDSESLRQLLATAQGEPLIQLNGNVAIANHVAGTRPVTAGAAEASDLARERIASERVEANLRQRQTSLRNKAKIEYSSGYAPKGK